MALVDGASSYSSSSIKMGYQAEFCGPRNKCKTALNGLVALVCINKRHCHATEAQTSRPGLCSTGDIQRVEGAGFAQFAPVIGRGVYRSTVRQEVAQKS